jgi:hypothetical protein
MEIHIDQLRHAAYSNQDTEIRLALYETIRSIRPP